MQQGFSLTTLLFCMLIFSQQLFAQDTPKDSVVWKKNGAANLNFSTVTLNNWAGGGQSSISLGTVLDGKLSRIGAKSTWDMYGNLALGGARVGDGKNLFKKTDDLLIIGTKYAYKMAAHWNFLGSVELRTQILNGYTFKRDVNGNEVTDQQISTFMAPGYLLNGLGLEYATKNEKVNFSASLQPLSGRTTFVLDDSLAISKKYTPDGSKVRVELGNTFKTNLELQVVKNVSFKTAFMAFAPYQDLAKIDVTWDALVVMKVNSFLTTSFGTNLLYFNDVKVDNKSFVVQYKHALAVNVGFKF